MPAAQLSVPAADLLVRALLDRLQAWMHVPLLRTELLPGDAPTVIVMTSDQDFVDEAAMDALAEQCAGWGAEVTFYLTAGTRQRPEDPPDAGGGGGPSPGWVKDAARRGAQFGVHPNAWGLPETVEAQALVLEGHLRRFRARYGRGVATMRFHRVGWPGYADTARLLERHGVAMDLDFLTLAIPQRPALGFMSGSQLPARFVDERGGLVNVLQQPTHVDDHVRFWESGRYLKLDEDAFIRATLEILAKAAERRGGPVVMNHHPLWFGRSPRWLRAVLGWAEERRVPVWSAERWLDYTLLRRAVRIWQEGREWAVQGAGRPIRVLVPRSVGDGRLRNVWCDGRWLSPGRDWHVGDQDLTPVEVPPGGCRLRLGYQSARSGRP
jgi:hypothetical protein